MKIGILTFHRAVNCGAMLQAWALKTFLDRARHDVGFIANHVGTMRRWYGFPMTGSILSRAKGSLLAIAKNATSFGCLGPTLKRFAKFQSTYFPEVDLCSCDVIVVGSDQVWRPRLTDSETSLFLGEKIGGKQAMISYAASFGDRPPDEVDAMRLIRSLERYKALSVRESLVKDFIASFTKRDIVVVADPTMLIDADDYSHIAANVAPKEPYLFAYAVHATPFFVNTARKAAKRLGLKLVMTAACQCTRWNAPLGMTYGVSPDRMIGYLKGASCVVASSFHGTALSLVHGKPFVCLREDGLNVKSRPVSLLLRLGDEGRVVVPQSRNADIDSRLNEPVSAGVLARLAEFREFSKDWLIHALAAAV